MEITLTLNEQQQELLMAILQTNLDKDTLSNTTKAIISQIISKMEQEYETNS